MVGSGISVSANGKTWARNGVHFAVGDFVYVSPDTFDCADGAMADTTNAVPEYANKGRFVKARPSPVPNPNFSEH